MLEHDMHWHASMLQSIFEHESHPDMGRARQLRALDQGAWRQHQAKQRIAQGRRLAMARDSNKRMYDDMSATEQQILQDYDAKKSIRQHAEVCVKKEPPLWDKCP